MKKKDIENKLSELSEMIKALKEDMVEPSNEQPKETIEQPKKEKGDNIGETPKQPANESNLESQGDSKILEELEKLKKENKELKHYKELFNSKSKDNKPLEKRRGWN